MGSLTPYSTRLPDAQPSPRAPYDLNEVGIFWGALTRRWRLFIAIVAGFVAFVGIATMLMPKSYTTTVRMLAGDPASQVSQAMPRSQTAA